MVWTVDTSPLDVDKSRDIAFPGKDSKTDLQFSFVDYTEYFAKYRGAICLKA